MAVPAGDHAASGDVAEWFAGCPGSRRRRGGLNQRGGVGTFGCGDDAVAQPGDGLAAGGDVTGCG